jgi:hypothetical protein
MESIAELASAMADRGGYDIRLEAAIAKLYNTEAGWRIVDDALQIRGGRGYETADSLKGRGEAPIPVERAMRDFRINLIFEGSSEIMRLFIAREAVDHHFKTAFDVVNPQATGKQKWDALMRSAKFYPSWYTTRWMSNMKGYGEFGPLAKHVRFIDSTTRKLGRAIFHAMVKLGPKLERRQMVLFRAVDIGAELFAMSAAVTRAQMLRKMDGANVDSAYHGAGNATDLADLFCREARLRIDAHFANLFGVNDAAIYRVSQQVLKGEFEWLERGIVDPPEPAPSGMAEEQKPSTRPEPAIV